MNKLEGFALITFIACDIFIENNYEIGILCKKINHEAKDVIKRLFK